MRIPHVMKLSYVREGQCNHLAQECNTRYLAFLRLTEGDEAAAPKRHLAIHLFRRMVFFGNPRQYATWRDESLNKLLKSACQLMSQATFEPRVLAHMAYLLRPKRKRQRLH